MLGALLLLLVIPDPAFPSVKPLRPMAGDLITYSFSVPSDCYSPEPPLIVGNRITITVTPRPNSSAICPAAVVRREVTFGRLSAGQYVVIVTYVDTGPVWSFTHAFDVTPVPVPIGTIAPLATLVFSLACVGVWRAIRAP
jgi:hypothetical protein